MHQINVKIPTGEFTMNICPVMARGFERLTVTDTIEIDGFGGTFEENKRRIQQYFEKNLFFLDALEDIQKLNFYLRMRTRYMYSEYKWNARNMQPLLFKNTITGLEENHIKSLIAHSRCPEIGGDHVHYGNTTYTVNNLSLRNIEGWCQTSSGTPYLLGEYVDVTVEFEKHIYAIVEELIGPQEACNNFTIFFHKMQLVLNTSTVAPHRFESARMRQHLFIIVPLDDMARANPHIKFMTMSIEETRVGIPINSPYAVLFDASREFCLPKISKGAYAVFIFNVHYEARINIREPVINGKYSKVVPFMLTRATRPDFESLLDVDVYFWRAIESEIKNIILSCTNLLADHLKSVMRWKIGWLDRNMGALSHSTKIWILQDDEKEKAFKYWRNTEGVLPGLIFEDGVNGINEDDDDDDDENDDTQYDAPELYYVFNPQEPHERERV